MATSFTPPIPVRPQYLQHRSCSSNITSRSVAHTAGETAMWIILRKQHRRVPTLSILLPISSQLVGFGEGGRNCGAFPFAPSALPPLQRHQRSLALGVEEFPDVFLLGRSRLAPQCSLEASLGLRHVSQLQRHEAAAVVISGRARIYLERGVEMGLLFVRCFFVMAVQTFPKGNVRARGRRSALDKRRPRR